MNPLLSIVIATKNRERYCIASIEAILKFGFNEIEICIADNSATTAIEDFIMRKKNDSIKYVYNPSEISSIDNFNAAMALATGEYIILIGDDDSVLPNIVRLAYWAKFNKVDTVSTKKIYTYFWPEANPSHPSGKLDFPSNQKDKIFQKNAYSNLIRLLNNGLVNYFSFPLPKSYHGLVKRELMQEIKDITGNYYGGLSPDIFSVVSISLLSKTHFMVDFAFSIAGVCPSSTTSDQIRGQHCGDLKDMPHLKNRKDEYIWDRLIPEFYSVTTTWGDSGLNALSAMRMDILRKEFNIYPLVAQGILMNRNNIFMLSINKSDKMRKELRINFLNFWFRVSISSLRLMAQKINKVLTVQFVKQKSIRNISSIEVALNEIVEDTGYVDFFYQ